MPPDAGSGTEDADDRQQLQFLVALGAGDGGVDEQRVALVGVEQRLAGEFQAADLGVDDRLTCE